MTSDIQSLQSQREALTQDITDYLGLIGVTAKEKVDLALKVIRESAYDSMTTAGADLEFMPAKTVGYARQVGLAAEAQFYYRLSWSFSPTHYKVMAAFVNRYEFIQDAEAEAHQAQEELIQQAVFNALISGSDCDDSNDFAVCVYESHIEVLAYRSGLADLLPTRNRKYVGQRGDIRWSYPLSSLEALQALGRPMVNVAALEAAALEAAALEAVGLEQA